MRYPIRWCIAALSSLLYAQGTLADYQRGQALAEKSQGLVINVPGPANWIGESDHFWYARTVKAGTEIVLVDAGAATKKAAFDHEKLAAAISSAMGKTYTALTLPFAPPTGGRGGAGGRGAAAATSSPLTFIDGERGIRFGSGGFLWKCTLTDYACAKEGPIPAAGPGGRGGRGAPADDQADSPEMVGGDPVDGLEYQAPPQQGAGQGGRGGRGSSGCAVRAPVPAPASAESQVCGSFDGKWEALIENFNVFLRPTGSKEAATALSLDGSEGNYYTFAFDRVVAGFQEAGGVPHAPGLRPAGALHRIVADGPASAEAHVDPLPQAGGRAGHRVSGAVRRGHEAGDGDRPGAVSQCVRPHPAGVVEGQPRVHVRVQSARPPGVPRDRGGRADRARRAR